MFKANILWYVNNVNIIQKQTHRHWVCLRKVTNYSQTSLLQCCFQMREPFS